MVQTFEDLLESREKLFDTFLYIHMRLVGALSEWSNLAIGWFLTHVGRYLGTHPDLWFCTQVENSHPGMFILSDS
jgi:hypothetical protein